MTVRVRELMDKNVVAVESDTRVSEALKRMIESRVWSLVVERESLAVGVLTDRDILRRCAALGHFPNEVKVETIMSSPIITVRPDATAGDAMRTMIDKNVRRLFVVEQGKIIGRITQTELFRSMLDVMTSLASLPYQL